MARWRQASGRPRLADDSSADADKAYAGSSPVTRAFGKESAITRRWVKNERLNHAGHLWAFASLRASAGASAHCRRRREQGDGHAAARRNLFNRMTGQLQHCLQHGRRFDGAAAFPVGIEAANRTAERQRTAVRQRTGLSYDKAKAREIAEAVMRSDAVSKNRPADLINIALEKIVEAGLELPGFTTLDALAAKVRTEANATICVGIYDQLSEAHRERLLALLSEKDESGTTKYNRLKQSAKAPTWSHFRAQAEHLGWVDELGETGGG